MKRFSMLSPRNLVRIAVVLLALSLFQLATDGEINWHRQALDTFSGTRGENTGWGKAVDSLETAGAAREGQAPTRFDLTGRVVRIADGDTLSLLDAGNTQHKVRFYGIDAPERDQPHGDRAREALVALVSGKRLGVVVIEEDDYGRKVGTVYAEGHNVNLAMVQQGHAWWYQYFARQEHALEAAERDARSARRGLWAADDPMPPWDWRRQQRLNSNR